MAVYNVDFRKIFVLAFLVVSFYWLMLPSSKSSESDPTSIPVIPLENGVQVDESTTKENNFEAKEKLEEFQQLHAKSMKDKDRIIETLQLRIKQHDGDTREKEEKLSKLESRIQEISLIADEKEKENKKILEQVASKQKETTTQPSQKDLKTVTIKREDSIMPFGGLKFVHLDLKGAPPKIDYLVQFIKLSKSYGANGFLIEYEDMFPWENELKVLAHKNAYSKEDIRNLLSIVKQEGMQVVPLIQTFGHLEFVLKHKEFAHLQAVKRVTTSICPLNNDSVALVKRLIDQVSSLHPNSNWIHLGGDEVWNIKHCDRCSTGNYSDTDLYLQHMMPIITYAKSKLVGETGKQLLPVIWDDMMRHWEIEDLHKMAKHVTPMVWGYVSNLETYLNFPPGMWDRYMQVFPKIWFASSFKGALKPWSNVVPIKQHVDNHLSWLKIYKKYRDSNKEVIGITLTGWSRFDHYGPLCELLPAGIPSLVLCLGILKQGNLDAQLHSNISKDLGFENKVQIEITSFKRYTPETATFLGHDVFTLSGALENAVGWKDWAEVRLNGWSRPYFVENNHLSFYQMNTSLSGLKQSIALMETVKVHAREHLREVFDDYIVEEWMGDKIIYFESMTKKSLARVSEIMEKFDN